jgi:hypothetical protein
MTINKVRTIFEAYSLEKVLYSLWLYRDSYLSMPVQIASTTTISIEFCDTGDHEPTLAPYQKEEIDYLVRVATSFCVNTSSGDRPIKGNSRELFCVLLQTMANQMSFSGDNSGAPFIRAHLLFVSDQEDHQLKGKTLSNEFLQDHGYSISEYIQTGFLAFAATNSNGMFENTYLRKSEMLFCGPQYDVLLNVLRDISFSSRHYKKKRNELNSDGSFTYHPILMKALIRPWSDIPQKDIRTRYLAPIPRLIGEQIHSGIYHHFLTKYGTRFTTLFGTIFQDYTETVLSHCIDEDHLITEEKLKAMVKIPFGVSIPDFLIVRDGIGLVIECKAARLPLHVYNRAELPDFESTLKKLRTATTQISTFSEYALKEKLFAVKAWTGVIITYGELWGMKGGLPIEVLSPAFMDSADKEAFVKQIKETAIISIGDLDDIQALMPNNADFIEIIQRCVIEPPSKIINGFPDDERRSFENSHLYPMFESLFSSMTKERSSIQTAD